jgi:hypothetical protein
MKKSIKIKKNDLNKLRKEITNEKSRSVFTIRVKENLDVVFEAETMEFIDLAVAHAALSTAVSVTLTKLKAKDPEYFRVLLEGLRKKLKILNHPRFHEYSQSLDLYWLNAYKDDFFSEYAGLLAKVFAMEAREVKHKRMLNERH